MKKLTNSIGKRLAKKPVLYYILSFTWALPTTILGYILILILLPFRKWVKIRKYSYTLAIVFDTPMAFGFSIGNTFVVDKWSFEGARRELENLPNPTFYNREHTAHEFGHTIHNAMFGPFVIFLVYLPSLIRYWWRELKIYRNEAVILPDYDSVWFEGTATDIGNAHHDWWYKTKVGSFDSNSIKEQIVDDVKNLKRKWAINLKIERNG